MTIPESQLLTWTNQGSVTNSASTHNVLRNALARHKWPATMCYSDYLQGSYANTTNIRGDSDVDIVIECTSIFYHNLTESEKHILQLHPAEHSFDEFRNEVINALVAYCGSSYVDVSGANSVKVLPSDTSNRLYADVVICTNYKLYEKLSVRGEGITFWNRRDGNQIVNFPKMHKVNGAAKNSNTAGTYKQTVRLFKNARRYLVNGDAALRRRFPSYFVECLLYNVPSNLFLARTWQQVYIDIVNYLAEVNDSVIDNFTTQSELHDLIGDSSVQWPKHDAQDFIGSLVKLWNDFYD